MKPINQTRNANGLDEWERILVNELKLVKFNPYLSWDRNFRILYSIKSLFFRYEKILQIQKVG